MRISQRDIVWTSLDPAKGREQRGKRPAVVISGNAFHVSGICIVCPLTTTLHRFVGDVILKPNPTNKLKEESEVLIGHARSISLERIEGKTKIGVIQETDLENIFKGIDLILDR